MIDQTRSEHGRYFLGPLPDVSSGITNLCSSDAFFCCYRPLSCWGLSRHSTGASQYFLVGSTAEQFDLERRDMVDEPWHPRTSGADLIVEVRVVDLYLKLKEKLFPDDRDLQVDMAALLRHVSTNVARRFHSRREEVRQAVEEMARKNGLDPAAFPLVEPVATEYDRFGFYRMPDPKEVVRHFHFTDPDNIRNIEDFLEYAGRLCVPPLRIRFPGDAAQESGPIGRSPARGLFERVRHRLRRSSSTR
jgi:hypothetical protein